MKRKYANPGLVGPYNRTICAKGRFAVPLEWRRIMGVKSLYGYRQRMVLPCEEGEIPCFVMGERFILDEIVRQCEELGPEDPKRVEYMTSIIFRRTMDAQGRAILKEHELEYLDTQTDRLKLYGNIDRFIVSRG
tara:strand:- start:872 stop:1273 length:402 start_codon:yes stop_codon:yes gene_type:complete